MAIRGIMQGLTGTASCFTTRSSVFLSIGDHDGLTRLDAIESAVAYDSLSQARQEVYSEDL